MKEVIFATTNQAKIKQLKAALAPAGVEVLGIPEGASVPEIIENGSTAQENARKKAITYAQALGRTVISMDNALYFDDLPYSQQPGPHVRRAGGSSTKLNDEEMLAHYSKLVEKMGGKVMGHWEFGICAASPEGEYQETTIISPRIFTSQVTTARVVGYPLEAMQIDPVTNKYISEMSGAEQDAFWTRAIGAKVQKFVKNITF